MTIRFTETDKWRDKWFRQLPPQQKLLFLWLIDNCDAAGFWEVDLDLAAHEIGTPKTRISGAFQGLNRAYLQRGEYIWIRRFIQVQRNWPLNPKNNAHKNILSKLESHSEFDVNFIEEINSLQNVSPKGGPNEVPCKSKGISKSNSISNGFFDTFWTNYPKKVGKGDALKSWMKINPSEELVSKMLFTLAWQVKSDQWEKDKGQFIPNPATWLNQERWTDEPVKSGGKSLEELRAEREREANEA